MEKQKQTKKIKILKQENLKGKGNRNRTMERKQDKAIRIGHGCLLLSISIYESIFCLETETWLFQDLTNPNPNSGG